MLGAVVDPAHSLSLLCECVNSPPLLQRDANSPPASSGPPPAALHYTPRVRQPSFPVIDLRANNTDEKQKRNAACAAPEKPPISVKNFFRLRRGEGSTHPTDLRKQWSRCGCPSYCDGDVLVRSSAVACQRPRTTSVVIPVASRAMTSEQTAAVAIAIRSLGDPPKLFFFGRNKERIATQNPN